MGRKKNHALWFQTYVAKYGRGRSLNGGAKTSAKAASALWVSMPPNRKRFWHDISTRSDIVAKHLPRNALDYVQYIHNQQKTFIRDLRQQNDYESDGDDYDWEDEHRVTQIGADGREMPYDPEIVLLLQEVSAARDMAAIQKTQEMERVLSPEGAQEHLFAAIARLDEHATINGVSWQDAFTNLDLFGRMAWRGCVQEYFRAEDLATRERGVLYCARRFLAGKPPPTTKDLEDEFCLPEDDANHSALRTQDADVHQPEQHPYDAQYPTDNLVDPEAQRPSVAQSSFQPTALVPQAVLYDNSEYTTAANNTITHIQTALEQVQRPDLAPNETTLSTKRSREEQEYVRKFNNLACKSVLDFYYEYMLPAFPILEQPSSTWDVDSKDIYDRMIKDCVLDFVTSVLDGSSPDSLDLLSPLTRPVAEQNTSCWPTAQAYTPSTIPGAYRTEASLLASGSHPECSLGSRPGTRSVSDLESIVITDQAEVTVPGEPSQASQVNADGSNRYFVFGTDFGHNFDSNAALRQFNDPEGEEEFCPPFGLGL